MHITSLDISFHALASVTENAFLAVANASYVRWEPLEVNGRLDILNPASVNAERIVATEVHIYSILCYHRFFSSKTFISCVEHLPKLAPRDDPFLRLRRVFSPPGLTNTTTGFPDPTKRTDRVFRHDHQFEWTVEEFQEWCAGIAQEWGYDVDTTTTGRAHGKDRWGRNEELVGPNQVAVFKHLEGEAWATTREEKSTQMKERNRGSVEEIANAVSDKFEEWDEAEEEDIRVGLQKNRLMICLGKSCNQKNIVLMMTWDSTVEVVCTLQTLALIFCGT
ncbi:uncharacterized protein EDB93DRAFT_1332630 [Suillus bovinus]|uniref:uncharacterized protein n=1 Tax=Suillus bovinus TaxID=48563 RepID=UPI001B87B34F|nr:uncharacterized protein EDB93DRAFT_1332630 [Suillus bovinus]KAG2127626.1 hypothetical protein EDB93DRAFT_1332630 [Suillus bovinus]